MYGAKTIPEQHLYGKRRRDVFPQRLLMVRPIPLSRNIMVSTGWPAKASGALSHPL
jgi:hypothetical protein